RRRRGRLQGLPETAAALTGAGLRVAGYSRAGSVTRLVRERALVRDAVRDPGARRAQSRRMDRSAWQQLLTWRRYLVLRASMGARHVVRQIHENASYRPDLAKPERRDGDSAWQ